MTAFATQHKLIENELRLKIPSGQMSLFKNRVAWAISYMKNAGPFFILSGANRNWQNDDPVKPAEEKIDIKTPEEIIGEAFKKLNETRGSELLDLIVQSEV